MDDQQRDDQQRDGAERPHLAVEAPVQVEVVPDDARHRRGVSIGAAVASAAVVALVAGSIGFVAGRVTSEDTLDDRTATAPSSTSAQDERSEPTAATTAVDELPEPTAATVTTEAGGEPASGGDGAAGTDGPAPGPGMFFEGAWPEPAQPLLVERTLADGTVLRVHGGWYGGDAADAFPELPGLDGWRPAPWCTPQGSLRVSVATPGSMNLSWAPWYAEPRDGVAVSTFATGYVEGEPGFGAVVQVPDDVTSVEFVTPVGRDQVAPTAAATEDWAGGVAVLLVPGEITDDLQVVLTSGEGERTLTPSTMAAMWGADVYRDECMPPPPPLPPAGEQPDDAAAAEAAVRAAWDAVHIGDDETRLAAIDDGTGLVAAWDELEQGPYAQAAATASFPVRELVFTTPDEAWFRYDVESEVADFSDRYGRAVLGEDGVWRITRDTVCQDLQLAGASCRPSVSQVLPPSAVGDPRYGPVEPEAPMEAPAATGAGE